MGVLNKTGNVRINVTLRRVREITVAVEKQAVLHILSVYVALVTQHANSMCHLSGCIIFFHIILQTARFRKKSY